ncbi:MAG: flagellar hook-length control protein FliK [Gammaproteobacteria bacterium]|jgi:flagellar hook-length control protein FliK
MVPIADQRMMQQIASVKTVSAASNLPFTLSPSALGVLGGQNEARHTFNNELLRQTQSIRVFEQPRERIQAATDRVRDNTFRDSSAQHQRTRNDESVSGNSRQADNSLSRNKTPHGGSTESSVANTFTSRAAEQRQENLQNRLESAQEKAASQANKTLETRQSSMLNGQDLQNVNNSQMSNKATSANTEQSQKELSPEDASLPLHESKSEKFDYIDYVTALADFTGKAVNTEAKPSAELGVDKISPKDLFMTPKPSLPDGELSATNALAANGSSGQLGEAFLLTDNLETLAPNIPANELLVGEKSEKISLTISKEDLQMLYDAKHNMQNIKADLLPGERAALDKIVTDLASQLETQTEENNHMSELGATDSNQSLLQTLLLGDIVDENTQDLNMGVNSELITSDEKVRLVADAIANAQLTAKAGSPDLGVKLANDTENQQTLGNAASSIKAAVDELGTIATKSGSSALPSELTGSTEQVLSKQANDTKKPEMASASLVNLAQLNEQQSQAALENLTQRVQTAVSQMSGENKGNEFIAALQSGVKEFKQQLAQGREPSIDLKAIVAEALAQITGESSKAQQPKIDAAVNQFNAVLQLATNVNSLATQQANGLGLSDGQSAKEINIGHVEGMKLANGTNGTTNQMTAQASLDKAVNIFKQEGQQQLAEKVRWMVNARSATAEIRLDPADLGGINIKINLSGDTAQVTFNVQSTAAKEALDQAAPRLREMLQEQGIELGQSSVQQDSQSSQQQQPSEEEASMFANAGPRQNMVNSNLNEDEAQGMVEQRISNGAIGGIDYYA